MSTANGNAISVGDVDAPQLLGPTLVYRDGVDKDGAGGERAQEVGGVGQAHRDHPPTANSGAGPDAGRALDGGGVDAAVDDSPWRMVLWAEIDVARHV